MSNDRTTHTGNIQESIVISGDGNTAAINIYHSQVAPAPPPELPPKTDYDRLPIPSSDLIGREKELALLDNAFSDPKKYVISIIAGGGVGKSALTYAWLDRIKPDYGGAKMIFGWSFYSQGSHDTQNSSAPFFQEAFRFFNYDKQLPKDEVEKGRELAKCLREKPSVLILDGMEPLQHPVKILNGEIRDTALKELLRCVIRYGLSDKSLVVISSRQPIVEFEQWKQGYEKIDLNVLNEKQSADLLETLGVRGSREDLEKAGSDMGGHALSLLLLGRLLADRFNGDVQRRDRLPNLFEDEKHGGHALRILQYYDKEYWQEKNFFKRLCCRITGKQSPERIFMRLLGLFDRPMGLKEKQVLCEKADFAKPLTALNDDEFQALEKRLENAGLLLKADKSVIRTEWDCHPLIRNHFGQIFRKEEENAFQQAHLVLFEYYQAVPGDNYQPDTLEEMEPLYRAVVHGCLAGEYQKALVDVYLGRIDRDGESYADKKLGAYAQGLTAISAFFPEGWEKPVSKGLSEANQAWLLQAASFCLTSLGRLAEAVEPRKLNTIIMERFENWTNAVISAECLVDLYLSIGSLKDAENAADQSITYADTYFTYEIDLYHCMVSLIRLATVLHQQGDLQESLMYFQEAEKIETSCYGISDLDLQESLKNFQEAEKLEKSYRISDLCQQDLQKFLKKFQEAEKIQKYSHKFPSNLFAGIFGAWYCNLLLDYYTDKEKFEIVLEQGRAWQYSRLGCSLVTISFNLLNIARALFALNRLDEASVEFDESVKGIRKSGTIDNTPPFLLARAKFFRHQKQFPEAWHDLDEAKDIIERCGMKLYAVDANLLEGNLFLDKDDGNEAMKCYKQAKELIGFTGYHLRDAELELLAARLAHFEKDSEKTQYYMNKSYQSIEKIGYWGFLAEWERVKNTCSFR
jgi:hypothetical protein